jgi:hypothetical protein
MPRGARFFASAEYLPEPNPDGFSGVGDGHGGRQNTGHRSALFLFLPLPIQTMCQVETLAKAFLQTSLARFV